MFCPMCGHEEGWSLRGAIGIEEASMRRVLLVLAVFVGFAMLILAVVVPSYLWASSCHQRDVDLAAMGYKAVCVKKASGILDTDVIPLEE